MSDRSLDNLRPPTGLRLRLLSAGRACFSDKGYHGTSVRDIARMADCSVASLYGHFESKSQLLAAIIEQVTLDLQRAADAALVPTGPNASERLRAVVVSHVMVHATDTQHASFIAASEARSLEPADRIRIIALRDGYEMLWRRIVDDGVRSGDFSCPYPYEAVRAILAMCTAVASWFHPDGPLTPADVAERYSTLALQMCGVTKAGRPSASVGIGTGVSP